MKGFFMGYTHYWAQTRDFTPEEFGDIAASVRKIVKAAEGKPTTTAGGYFADIPVKIYGGAGTGQPKLTKKLISFNGAAPELDHETFYLEPKRGLPYPSARPDQLGWAFCKTARKPYDVVVVACLTFLQADYGFEVSSDGNTEDWAAGVQLAEEALGRQFANPLIVEQMLA
jgi:hypothetical protein